MQFSTIFETIFQHTLFFKNFYLLFAGFVPLPLCSDLKVDTSSGAMDHPLLLSSKMFDDRLTNNNFVKGSLQIWQFLLKDWKGAIYLCLHEGPAQIMHKWRVWWGPKRALVWQEASGETATWKRRKVQTPSLIASLAYQSSSKKSLNLVVLGLGSNPNLRSHVEACHLTAHVRKSVRRHWSVFKKRIKSGHKEHTWMEAWLGILLLCFFCFQLNLKDKYTLLVKNS